MACLFIHFIQLFEYSFKILTKYRQNKISDPHVQLTLIMQLIHLAGFWYLEIPTYLLITDRKNCIAYPQEIITSSMQILEDIK